MMQVSSRQSGAVNMILFVLVLVLTVAFVFLWYTEFKDNEAKTKAKEEAEAKLESLETRAGRYTSEVNRLLTKSGLPELEMPGETDESDTALDAWAESQIDSKLTLLDSVVNESRSLFNGDESMTKMTDVLKPAQGVLEGLEAEVARLKRELETAKADKANAETANDTLVSTHRDELSRKNQELSEERDRSARAVAQAEEQTDAAQQQITSITGELEQRLSETRAQISKAESTVFKLDGEVAKLKNHTLERTNNAPDGQIIEVNKRLGTCYIDLGSKHQLRRGTRFKVFGYEKGQVRVDHGFVTVRDVEYDRALCAIDSGAMPKANDKVHNPYFDKDTKRSFFFLGSLPGRYDNQRAAAILRDFGASVTDKVTVDVDYIVLGANPDPEAAVGEDADPNWFKSTVEYTDGKRWGVEFLRARDLEDFIRF